MDPKVYIESQIANDEHLARTMVELFTGSRRTAAARIIRDIISTPRSRFAIELSNLVTAQLRYRHTLGVPE